MAAEPLPIWFTPAPRSPSVPRPPEAEPAPQVELTIDDAVVSVPAGSTILEASRAQGIDIPTLCFLESLAPVNVCRVCVVEVAGSRTLVPACSRPVEPDMDIRTDSERVRLARRLVLELLGSSVDLSIAGTASPDGSLARWMEEYAADPSRFGPAAETVAQPVTVDNDLYVRDYARCILCYKCVEACGDEAQNTFAIAVAGRGFDAHISTEWATPLPTSACVYCGNCIGVCPTGALMGTREHEMRAAGTWDEARQAETDTICPYCGVGCTLTLRTQDDRIVRVTSPLDQQVSDGHLCVKGRFGWPFIEGEPDR